MTKLEAAIAFCGFFEAELLTSLMLSHWEHPRASDQGFANDLLETAAEVLNRSQSGERLFENVPPDEMNLVAALWYGESCQVSGPQEHDTEQRRKWLAKVRHALPSCFCDPADLHEP